MATGGRANSSGSRDRRPLIYAILDLVFLLLYLVLAVAVAPARGGSALLVQWLLVLSMLLAAGGMMWRTPWGWRISALGCCALLTCELLLLVLLVASASFLAGVYGSFGRGALSLVLVVAALSIELVALVPAFQLKYLRTRAGRRAFGLAGRER
jgi:hypothetical protein